MSVQEHIAPAVPTVSGKMVFQTADDGENVLISVDGELVVSMGPRAVYALETSWFENGLHMLELARRDRAGLPVGEVLVSPIEVRN